MRYRYFYDGPTEMIEIEVDHNTAHAATPLVDKVVRPATKQDEALYPRPPEVEPEHKRKK